MVVSLLTFDLLLVEKRPMNLKLPLEQVQMMVTVRASCFRERWIDGHGRLFCSCGLQ